MLGPLAPAMKKKTKKAQLTTLYHVIILYPDETSLLSPHIPSSLIGSPVLLLDRFEGSHLQETIGTPKKIHGENPHGFPVSIFRFSQ